MTFLIPSAVILCVLFLKLSLISIIFFCNYFRIVGRAAFTGNHQWILSNNYSGDAHPPEVYNKISSSGLTKTEFDVNQDVKFLTFG